MNPGVNATKRTGAMQDVANGRALNFGVQHQVGVELSTERAAVSGSFGVTGVAAAVMALAGLWALDRYVLPAVKAA